MFVNSYEAHLAIAWACLLEAWQAFGNSSNRWNYTVEILSNPTDLIFRKLMIL